MTSTEEPRINDKSAINIYTFLPCDEMFVWDKVAIQMNSTIILSFKYKRDKETRAYDKRNKAGEIKRPKTKTPKIK